MKKITLLISALVFTVGGAFAQNKLVGSPTQIGQTSIPTQRTCGAMDMVSHSDLDAFQDWLAPKVATYLNQQAMGGSPEVIYNIPTVVHVIHNSTENVGQGRNINPQRIIEQIQILNDDFRRTNSDASNTPGVFTSVAADTEINFCLIQTYPTGHPLAGQAMSEAGVDRVDATTIGLSNTTSGYSTGQVDGTIKPATSWNPNQVMNIWVCQLQGGLLGYAQFPNSGSANTDGTVMGYQFFGLTGGAFGLGRTTTHEVGHWLGLRHIWGDASCGNDQVGDTPTQQTSTNGCPSHPRPSCGNSGDMFQNYMDYSNDNCMNIFTAGQKAVMQNVMASANRRSTLNAASLTLCAPAPLTASFNANTTTITVGQTITFTSTSGGPNGVTTYAWNFDVNSGGGVSPSTANTQGAHVVTYNNQGVYSVSLQVGDGTGTDIQIKTSYITVLAAGTSVCDTVTSYVGTATLLGSDQFGWISGHNNYDDRGKANVYPAVPSGFQLTGVEMLFGKTHDGTGSGSIDVVVWDNTGAGGAPGAVIHTQSIAISSLNLFPTPTQFTFGLPVTVTGAYYVGIQFSANTGNSTQDSIALITNADGETSPGTAWELWGDASWHEYSEDPASWGTNQANAIFVQMCNNLATSVSDEVAKSLINVYPNPTRDFINITLPSVENTKVVVYNMVGEVVYVNNNIVKARFSIDMNNHPNGVYFVKISSENSVITKKVILSK